jgi:pantoate--beta-alanine ligase
METIHTLEWMKQLARQARAENRILGFVPTSGRLHEGHFSLIRAARSQCSPVVVSVFEHPEVPGDAAGPRPEPLDLDADRAALEALDVDFLFVPTVAEMFPPGFRTRVYVEGLGDILEGRFRPGHFRGLATAILKFMEILQPNFTYLGRKDAQQARLIRQLASDLNLDSEIVVCPIVREPDGLALSSRNRHLRPDERRAATALHAALCAARREILAGQRDALKLLSVMRQSLAAEPLLHPNYVELVDSDTFESVTRLRRSCLALLAVRVGTTRLLDNMLIEESENGFLLSL